jgi:hypothetical protein
MLSADYGPHHEHAGEEASDLFSSPCTKAKSGIAASWKAMDGGMAMDQLDGPGSPATTAASPVVGASRFSLEMDDSEDEDWNQLPESEPGTANKDADAEEVEHSWKRKWTAPQYVDPEDGSEEEPAEKEHSTDRAIQDLVPACECEDGLQDDVDPDPKPDEDDEEEDEALYQQWMARRRKRIGDRAMSEEP